MLHPVGPLPAAVYWRRRFLVLTLLLAVLGGGGWVGYAVATGTFDEGTTTAAATRSATSSIARPALEQVVPSLAGVRTPTPVPAAASSEPSPPAAPAPGSPCTDEMILLEIRTPGGAALGEQPTFELVVTNGSAVPCVRALDSGLQELVLLDAAGNRVWGSNDCAAEVTSDLRTLAPGEMVRFPVPWTGLTSEPTCLAPRVLPATGDYVVRGRLDTKISEDEPFAIR